MIPVAAATAEPPNEYAILVVMEDADRLTMLLPIKMALNILPESSVISITFFARLLPSSAKERMRILLTVVSDVSAEEKNPEKNSKMIKIIICVATLESTCLVTPFCS